MPSKFGLRGTSPCGSAVTNPTNIHEDTGSIPGPMDVTLKRHTHTHTKFGLKRNCRMKTPSIEMIGGGDKSGSFRGGC